MHGLHWQLNLFPMLCIGKWTCPPAECFFLHHLLDRPCVLQMPSFGRRAKAHLVNTPTERLSLRQPLVLLCYTMNGFLASNGNGIGDSLQAIPTGFLSICSARAQEPLPLFCRWLRLLHFLQVHLCGLPFACRCTLINNIVALATPITIHS